MTELHFSFPADRKSYASMRQSLGASLLDVTDPGARCDVMIAAGELFTNALYYGHLDPGSMVEFNITVREAEIELVVQHANLPPDSRFIEQAIQEAKQRRAETGIVCRPSDGRGMGFYALHQMFPILECDGQRYRLIRPTNSALD